MSINRAGTLALIANRADNSVSVLRITGKKVELIDTVVDAASRSRTSSSRPTASARWRPSSPATRSRCSTSPARRSRTTSTTCRSGLWPYNVDVTPDGKLALTADNGNSGAADGQVDTVSVIDLEAAPPRVIDKVVVGDGPEGLAISPTGKLAVAVLLRGSNAAKSAFFYNQNGSVVGAADRRQDGHEDQRDRGRRPAGRRGRSATTADISTSATSSTRTSRSCASTATDSSTPASA